MEGAGGVHAALLELLLWCVSPFSMLPLYYVPSMTCLLLLSNLFYMLTTKSLAVAYIYVQNIEKISAPSPAPLSRLHTLPPYL